MEYHIDAIMPLLIGMGKNQQGLERSFLGVDPSMPNAKAEGAP